ncbi:MAG: matrixin family metalloprotease [Bryobacteraceae bacterium]
MNVVSDDFPAFSPMEALRARGIHVLGYVPGGFFVSIPEGVSLADTGVEWVAPLEAAQKISPLLQGGVASNGPMDFLVEFHGDVPGGDARTVALRAGFLWSERSDLLPNHLLVTGSPSRLRQLAEWDEVAYVFPAMAAMSQAAPLYACGGALTKGGPVTQSVAVVGNGWDGPGLGAASLYYSFLNVTAKLAPSSTKAEVVRALEEWAKYVQVTFSPTMGAPVRTIAVEFVTGDHADGYPFTSAAQLAHTFYPWPMSPEPIAGDMHFNDVESWHIGADIDLFSLALHEAGHALGLGHSDNPNDVMYPYYRRVTGLSPGDISAIQMLYAARSGSGAPTTAGLLLTVVPPPVSTSAASIGLSGTVSGGSGNVAVQWMTTAGASGMASSSPSWMVSSVPLVVGPNTITVTATDSAGNRASQSLPVTRTSGAAPPPPQNPAPASLTITSPASTNVGTSASTITVSGAATSTVGLVSVTWTSSIGSGTATGLANWNTGKIPLMIGTNTIVIRATDVAGATAWRSLMVTRQ